MGGQVSSIKAAAGKLASDNKKRASRGDKVKISILAFEVANVMSKSIVLWQSLSDQEIIRLRTEVIKSEGVLKLVSDSEAVLLSLACREKLQDLMALAGSVARLGKRCQEAALQGFEHVFNDILRQNIEVSALEFSVKEMEGKVKKMERYIASTSNLYQELEILADLEQAVRRIQDDHEDAGGQRDNLVALEQKISWQRQEIKYLRELSLWNRTYDKIVMLLARTICTIHGRIVCVFGPPASFDYLLSGGGNGGCSGILSRDQQQRDSCHRSGGGSFLRFSQEIPANAASATFVEACNGGLGVSSSPSPTETSQASPVESDLRRSSSEPPADHHNEDLSRAEDQNPVLDRPPLYRNGYSMKLQKSQMLLQNGRPNRLFFDPKFLQQTAPSSTLGGCALSLHYANVIIIVEKMVKFPQLVGNDARDDLYRMLPKSLRLGLRSRLRSCLKNTTTQHHGRDQEEAVLSLEAGTASAWRENLDHVLNWLAPLAHNMIRWQSEHNFEQQVVSRTNVLLLQTLFFADQAKAEEAMVELLVGLNYLCWYEKEMKASLPGEYAAAAASKDLEEYLDWQF